MLLNYTRYPEVIFLDISVRKTARKAEFGSGIATGAAKDSESDEDEDIELNLIILSGLNSEGQNVIFGAGIVH
jgi:hypothetical protein